ncbi:MAG: hypothetical protein JW800_02040 [Candidatus Omnitrophica bacterium]|nr:hypothetical protein [Candidatus Omnitrophota bacterium]
MKKSAKLIILIMVGIILFSAVKAYTLIREGKHIHHDHHHHHNCPCCH